MADKISTSSAPKRTMWRFMLRTGLATVIVGLLVGYSMCFVVPEGSNAVVTRFGDPQKSIRQAGLFWKWPWPVEQSHGIDVRRRLHNTPFTATLTRDRKNVILLTYVVWRVEDPLAFLQSLGSAEAADLKLDGMVAASKNFHLGRYDLASLVSTVPGHIKIPEIEQAVLRTFSRRPGRSLASPSSRSASSALPILKRTSRACCNR